MSKLKLNLSEKGAEEILTREELKQIVGGTGSGGTGSGGVGCADGETKYYCTASAYGSGNYSGYVCASNAQKAADKVVEELKKQGIDEAVVSCSF